MRITRAVHQLFPRTHPLALVDVDVDAPWQRVLPRLGPVVGHDDDLALTLDDPAFLDDAVDLGNDSRIARLARLEQLHHARQAAVMSLVFVVSRGILASTSPASTDSPSCTIRCACDGMWYLRTVLPVLSLISSVGCFFSSGESTMMKRERPVTSSTSSCTVMPSRMSLNLTLPRSSVRIENV